MLLAGWLWLCAALCSLLLGQAEAPNPGVPPERSRPYSVLRGQNLGERGGAGRGGAGCAFAARADSTRAWERAARELSLTSGAHRASFPAVSPSLGASSLALCAGGTC